MHGYKTLPMPGMVEEDGCAHGVCFRQEFLHGCGIAEAAVLPAGVTACEDHHIAYASGTARKEEHAKPRWEALTAATLPSRKPMILEAFVERNLPADRLPFRIAGIERFGAVIEFHEKAKLLARRSQEGHLEIGLELLGAECEHQLILGGESHEPDASLVTARDRVDHYVGQAARMILSRHGNLREVACRGLPGSIVLMQYPETLTREFVVIEGPAVRGGVTPGANPPRLGVLLQVAAEEVHVRVGLVKGMALFEKLHGGARSAFQGREELPYPMREEGRFAMHRANTVACLR